jgi:hypothetical protein
MSNMQIYIKISGCEGLLMVLCCHDYESPSPVTRDRKLLDRVTDFYILKNFFFFHPRILEIILDNTELQSRSVQSVAFPYW